MKKLGKKQPDPTKTIEAYYRCFCECLNSACIACPTDIWMMQSMNNSILRSSIVYDAK